MKEAFPPVISPNARILILGTMPSELSLERQEYYGNPRNQFWPIMQAVFDIPAEGTYAVRISGLRNNQVALWDVLHSCERVGSLDSAIKNAIPNDFAGLFASLPELKIIAFNGKKANKWFQKWVQVDTFKFQKAILLSTSPAAAVVFEKKVVNWAALKTL
ncbi:MAG: DNA-deoxyinosine glycosylase [Chloroflexi bacterium]|nr:DNA-deoxyinosine glycosylase [Chloroflexota bacterium]